MASAGSRILQRANGLGLFPRPRTRKAARKSRDPAELGPSLCPVPFASPPILATDPARDESIYQTQIHPIATRNIDRRDDIRTRLGDGPCAPKPFGSVQSRSEEHTSKLQSLMRISYEVFCL